MKINISKLFKSISVEKPKPINEFFDFVEQPIYNSTLIDSYQQHVLNEAVKAKSLGFFNAAVVEEAKEINKTLQKHTDLNKISDTQQKDLVELREIYPYRVFTKYKVDEICKANNFYSNSARVYSGEIPKKMVTLMGIASGYRRELVHGVVNYEYGHFDSFTGKRLIEINNPCFKRLSELHPEQQKNIGRTTTSGPLGYSRYEMIQPYYFRLITRFNFTEFNINSLEEVVILMPVLHNSNLYYLLIK